MSYIALAERVQKAITDDVKSGIDPYRAAWNAEEKFNVGVYVDPAGNYNSARMGHSRHWFEVYYKRSGIWNRRACAFFVKAI